MREKQSIQTNLLKKIIKTTKLPLICSKQNTLLGLWLFISALSLTEMWRNPKEPEDCDYSTKLSRWQKQQSDADPRVSNEFNNKTEALIASCEKPTQTGHEEGTYTALAGFSKKN